LNREKIVQEVSIVAVIGAGPVGRSIALCALAGGYQTILEDVSPEALEEAHHWIEQGLKRTRVGEMLSSNSHPHTLARLTTAPNVNDAIREADLIIDAVPDELEMKLELFTIFDKFAKPGAIFASATSPDSIADFSDVTVYRDRCIGLRFYPASADAKRVEIIRTPRTSEETVKACEEVARRMGQEIVS
jgi:3-hydroxyacyl-CoA dehydrogenase